MCIDGVKNDPERLTALVILGIRDEEQFPRIFYGENCADMALYVDEIDENYIAGAHKNKLLPGKRMRPFNGQQQLDRYYWRTYSIAAPSVPTITILLSESS